MRKKYLSGRANPTKGLALAVELFEYYGSGMGEPLQVVDRVYLCQFQHHIVIRDGEAVRRQVTFRFIMTK